MGDRSDPPDAGGSQPFRDLWDAGAVRWPARWAPLPPHARLHARAQLATTVGAHPMPVADPTTHRVDHGAARRDLVGSFETAATAVGARVTRIATSAQLAGESRDIRRRHSIRVAVASKQPGRRGPAKSRQLGALPDRRSIRSTSSTRRPRISA
ncbi:MAG: hypothetical protein R2705_12650 [Ilumatobacteraceae bacterium]